MRERRAQDGGGDDGVLAEHLVEVAETEHHDRPDRHLALDREVLSHHRCQFGGHVRMLLVLREFDFSVADFRQGRDETENGLRLVDVDLAVGSN